MSRILFAAVSVAVMSTAYACGGIDTDQLTGARRNVGGSGASAPYVASVDGSTATGGGSSDASAPSVNGAPAGACLPASIQTMLTAKCTGCHSDPPVNGSLAGLVTLADLLAPAKEDATKNEAQLSLARMQNAGSPMPPASSASPSTPAEIADLSAWIAANYTSASCTSGGGGGGGSPPPPATDVFTGTPGFASQVASSAHHAGQDCMGSCHNHGFTFAGTVTDGAGSGVAGAEVRLVDANQKAISVYTDTNGNFYTTTGWTAPAKVGVRDATVKGIMVAALKSSDGGCNGCHASGGSQSPMHLP